MRNSAKTISIVAAALAIFGSIPARSQPDSPYVMDLQFSSSYKGQTYTFDITQQELESAPEWADDEDNPPVSMRKAMTLARADLKANWPDAANMPIVNISLHKLDWDFSTQVPAQAKKWYYMVQFSPTSSGDKLQFIQVPVLMDGTAKTPTEADPDSIAKQ